MCLYMLSDSVVQLSRCSDLTFVTCVPSFLWNPISYQKKHT